MDEGKQLRDEINRLNLEVDRLVKENVRSRELAESVARATANSTEMFLELEEKTEEIERQKTSLQEAFETLDTMNRELSTKNELLKTQGEQIAWELQTASDVQKTIMCRPYETFPEIEIAVQTSPATQINGDFYIIHPIDFNSVAILIADGVGHGVPAALMSIMARAFFQDIATKNGSPGKIFTELNQRLHENLFEGAYLTGFLMIYNRVTNQVRYASAGHCPAILISRETGGITELESIDPVLGLMAPFEFGEKAFTVDAGDRLYLYTDGIVEARVGEHEFYGMERFINALKNNYAENSLSNQVDSIMNDVYEFCGTLEQDDDRTLIIAEFRAVSEKSGIRKILESFSADTPRSDYTLLFNSGVERIRNGDYDNAILIFAAITSAMPENFKAWYDLGIAYEKINEGGNARECWEKVKSILAVRISREKDETELRSLREWEEVIARSLKKIEGRGGRREEHVKTEIISVEISVEKNKLVEFCRRAVTMPIFAGLELKESDDDLVIDYPGEGHLLIRLDGDTIFIDEKMVPEKLTNKLYLIFEGLACAFHGNFVVVYTDEAGTSTKVSIIDGMYTSCGNRCMARNVVFPVID